MLQHQFDSEKAVLEQLEKQYQAALNDINRKIRILQSDEMTQSKIYRLEYQKALKKQVEAILEKLHGDEFTTIQEYLSASYTDAFIGTMYDIAGQGIPLIIPLDQAAAVTAILTDSKISEGLYSALGVDTGNLKKAISAEVTRGIASGMAYNDIARNISNVSKAPLSRAKTIVRTEGHRIQQKSTKDAQQEAKSKGADVVKQWDATLDGKTRPSHKKVDGEIRELDEKFSNGLDYPGDPGGKAGEVVNCRCVSLTRARWALDEDELKTLKERAKFFELDKSKNFEDFKEKYLKAAAEPLEKSSKSSTIKARNMSDIATGGKRNEEPLSDAQIAKAKEAAKKQGYKGEILYSDYSNTSFHGSTEGEAFHYMVIGTDAFPVEDNGGTANELISLDGCMAHEVVGHFEAWLKGTTQSVDVLEEAQASIRASKFGVGLSKEERQILYKDAIDRLNHAGILLDDVIDSLDVWER